MIPNFCSCKADVDVIRRFGSKPNITDVLMILSEKKIQKMIKEDYCDTDR